MGQTSKATWIWYPGDFEVWLGNIFNNRRTERGAMFPPFWKQDSHWPTVEFSTTVELEHDETVCIAVEGQFNLMLDGKLQFGMPQQFTIPAGKHRLNLKVWNQATPPALFMEGETVKTDASWLVTYEDKIWIDESGVAHGSGIYVPVASWCFNSIDTPPSSYRLERSEQRPAAVFAVSQQGQPSASISLQGQYVASVPVSSPAGNALLYDFGRETFGYLKLKGLQGTVRVYYGESREEALDKDHCETLDVLSSPQCNGPSSFSPQCNGPSPSSPQCSGPSPFSPQCNGPSPSCPQFPSSPQCSGPSPFSPQCNGPSPSCPLCSDLVAASSKAFRYVCIEKEPGSSYDDVLMDYEYAPFEATKSGSFCCSDNLLNRIWNVSAYTMDLTTREFFMDGIKRDRWIWSGDAVQSYLMNYYLRFDTECVKRTIRQLRGKDPVTSHVNTIMDYTFYWFKSIADYYAYTADRAFVCEMWPRMVTLMDYVLSRTNADGLAEGRPDDWIFVDWTDFPMHKRGVLCFEQILFMKSLETMAACAELIGEPADRYRQLAHDVRRKTNDLFWSDDDRAYLHALEPLADGGYTLNGQVTKFPNMFAVLYALADSRQQEQIMQSVMTNSAIDPITTPYMRFYELETLCRADLHCQVLSDIRSYWGGMLREGATTFWEKYVPTESGTQHLAMYGRPYGKSLCHAWGASPVYLLGRYFLGVSPTKPGYAEYEVRPQLGDLEWMRGAVPTPFGLIRVAMDRHTVTVASDGGIGTLIIGDRRITIPPGKEITVNDAALPPFA